MDFSRPYRRPLREPILPMINVVFLLLIFFLMSARLQPADPFDLSPPQALSAEHMAGGQMLYIAPDGAVAMGGLRGDAVWQALSKRPEAAVVIRADASMRAVKLAEIIARLGQLGIVQIQIGAVSK